MRNRTLLFLACCIGLSGGVSCTTRHASSSSSQTPSSEAVAAAAAEAKAQKEKEAADAKALKQATAEAKLKQAQEAKMAAAAAKAKKKQDAADAKALKKAQAEAARQAKAGMSTTATNLGATPAPVPAMEPNAPLTKEQKLNDLNRRYKNDEITPLEYQTERAKIMAEP